MQKQIVLALTLTLLTFSPAHAGPPNPTASDAAGNTAGGTGALVVTTRDTQANTGFGWRALSKNTNIDTATGDANTAAGYVALSNNTTGAYNTAAGVLALTANRTGTFNTATGTNSLAANTTGNYNTADGAFALPQNTIGIRNTGVGSRSLNSNITGSNNTACGDSALYSNRGGSNNTGVGYLTLLRAPSGQNNTAIGTGAGSTLANGSNNIYLGHIGVASESATMRLGGPQTRTFIAGVAGVPISGRAVVISPSGQLGVGAAASQAEEIVPQLVEELVRQAQQIETLTRQVRALMARE